MRWYRCRCTPTWRRRMSRRSVTRSPPILPGASMTEHPCAGRELLLALKNTAGAAGPQLTLAVGRPPVALLRPVATRPQYLNPGDVKVLTFWRNKFVRSFLTEFEATEARTAQWLTQVVGPNSGKLLFMVDNP